MGGYGEVKKKAAEIDMTDLHLANEP